MLYSDPTFRPRHLAVFALHGDAAAAGAARFGCILVGVSIGAVFLLAVNRVWAPRNLDTRGSRV